MAGLQSFSRGKVLLDVITSSRSKSGASRNRLANGSAFDTVRVPADEICLMWGALAAEPSVITVRFSAA
jgi:hypothetical protein